MEYTRDETFQVSKLVADVMMKLYGADGSGKLLYLFASMLDDVTRLKGYHIDDKYKFVVIKKDEYDALKNN